MFTEPEVTIGPFFTVNQIAERHDAVTVPMLRWWLLHRRENGLDAAVRKIGRRVLVDEKGFLRWIDRQTER